jgi:hypothetical protein
MRLYDEDADNTEVFRHGTQIACPSSSDRVGCWTMAALQINIRLSGAAPTQTNPLWNAPHHHFVNRFSLLLLYRPCLLISCDLDLIF